jgi:hypothetical protein
LERNILKYRTFEMVVILFHIEDLREYVLRTIRANDKARIPEGTKKPYEKAWAYLVEKGIITQDERDDVRRLVDYRNTIAHEIQQLTYDLSQDRFGATHHEVKYDYKALRRLKKYREKIEKGLQHMTHMVLSFDGLMFEAAERTFEQELTRLRKKMDKLFAERQAERKRVSQEIAALRDSDFDEMALCHPGNQVGENGKLTERGARLLEEMFKRKVSPLAVSYLMRLSLRATSRRYKEWKATRNRGHTFVLRVDLPAKKKGER